MQFPHQQVETKASFWYLQSKTLVYNGAKMHEVLDDDRLSVVYGPDLGLPHTRSIYNLLNRACVDTIDAEG